MFNLISGHLVTLSGWHIQLNIMVPLLVKSSKEFYAQRWPMLNTKGLRVSNVALPPPSLLRSLVKYIVHTRVYFFYVVCLCECICACVCMWMQAWLWVCMYDVCKHVCVWEREIERDRKREKVVCADTGNCDVPGEGWCRAEQGSDEEIIQKFSQFGRSRTLNQRPWKGMNPQKSCGWLKWNGGYSQSCLDYKGRGDASDVFSMCYGLSINFW